MPRKSGEPSRTLYPARYPTWVELRTPDQDAAKDFYSGLFGWEYYDQPMPDGPSFSLAMHAGKPIAVIAPQAVMIAQREPPVWITHCAVSNFDRAPVGHVTADLIGEAYALYWTKLIPPAEGLALPLHQRVQDDRGPEMVYDTDSYTIFLMDGVALTGVATPHGPATANYRHAYFVVADTDKAVAFVTALGGGVLMDPTDTSGGRISRVADPQGAAFSLVLPADNPPRVDPTGRQPKGL